MNTPKSLVNSDQDPLVSESIDVKEELSHDLCDVTIAGILTETQINQVHESVTDNISNVTKSVTSEELKVSPSIICLSLPGLWHLSA